MTRGKTERNPTWILIPTLTPTLIPLILDPGSEGEPWTVDLTPRSHSTFYCARMETKSKWVERGRCKVGREGMGLEWIIE